MKLLRVDFDDEESPATADVRLSVTELALLYNLTGRIAPLYVTQAAGGDQKWGEALSEVADCVGSFFNRFWDAGVDDVAPKFSVESIAAQKAGGRGRDGESDGAE